MNAPVSLETYKQFDVTTPVGSTEAMDSTSPGFILLVLSGVLGGVALILGIVYAYIYYAKIKPRQRPLADDRINYYERDACAQYGGQTDKDQQEKIPIKTHPFFVLSYLSRMKSNDHGNHGGASTSSKRY